MTDIVSKQTRSRMMSGIRGKNTKPELIVRRGLHARGIRYRLHDRSLPGRPDLVIRKRRVAIFVHGCFWHGHTGCQYFRLPSSNADFWSEKIAGNRMRDSRQAAELLDAGWRLALVWECRVRREAEAVIAKLQTFIESDSQLLEIG